MLYKVRSLYTQCLLIWALWPFSSLIFWQQNLKQDHFMPSSFLHTMILGRVAYRGVLSRRSAVTTAGVLILIVSSPPSISRTTLILSPSNDTSDAKVPCNAKIKLNVKTVHLENRETSSSLTISNPTQPVHCVITHWSAPSTGQPKELHLNCPSSLWPAFADLCRSTVANTDWN